MCSECTYVIAVVAVAAAAAWFLDDSLFHGHTQEGKQEFGGEKGNISTSFSITD